MATPDQWLGKLANLKVDKARGDPAPHKPLLLLVVLELAEQTQSFGDILPLTPELAFRFCTYWSVVAVLTLAWYNNLAGPPPRNPQAGRGMGVLDEPSAPLPGKDRLT